MSDTFPFHDVAAMLGPRFGRWLAHRKHGQIADLEGQAAQEGAGRGAKLRLTLEAVVQGAIALRLIDCGVEVRRAYIIGAKFAYFGAGFSLVGQDQQRDREPGRLFSEGRTWLVVSPHGDDGSCLNYEIFTDDEMKGCDGDAVLSSIPFPIDFDHQPNILLDLTATCEFLAKGLDLPFERFLPRGK